MPRVSAACVSSGGAYADSHAASDVRLHRAAASTQRAPDRIMLAVAAAGKRVVAAGERGLVVTSDDCGQTRRQARVPSSVTLTSMFFLDDSTGWATGHGGLILRTSDADATSERQLDGTAIARLAMASAKADALVLGGDDDKARTRLRNAEQLLDDGAGKPHGGRVTVAEQVSDAIRVLPLPVALPAFAVKQHWHERYHADASNRWLRQVMARLFSE